MKKKVLKALALIAAIALIVGIAYVANSLNGNPISRMLADRAAEQYLEQHFPDTDYYVENLGFSFKFVGYYAHIGSESSIDTRFSLHIDMIGNVFHDTYESVTDGSVTARRLEREYRELTDQIFESPSFPYPSEIQFGTLEIHSREAIGDPHCWDIPDYAIVQEDLILDRIYDIRQLGAQAGHLIVYVDSETISFKLAAEILLEIRSQFDRANIPFRAIDFVLEMPLPEEGQRPDEAVWIEDFAYSDIYAEGLADRIAEAHAAREAMYDAMDDK